MRSTLFHSFRKQSPGFGIKEIRHVCFATDRFQAILVRARSAMKQRKENSNDTTRPNWHFRFFFFFLMLRVSFRIFSLHARLSRLTRLPLFVKRKVKSVTFVLSHESDGHARVLPFSFFFATTYVTFRRIRENHYHLRFYRCKYPAKRDSKRLYGIFKRE